MPFCPESRWRSAWQNGQQAGGSLLECKRCGSPPLLSHFPDQLKLGKNAFLPEEPQGDSHGRLDSVAAGGGVSASECCLSVRQTAGAPLDRTDSVAAGGGVSASERCNAPMKAAPFPRPALIQRNVSHDRALRLSWRRSSCPWSLPDIR